MPYRFEPLDPERHDRSGFQSSVPALTAYLQQRARKDAERHLAVTFVMVEESAPAIIAGYYTLSNYTVELAELPGELTKRLPRYPRLPATLIGRLARDERFPGTGKLLLMDAILRSYSQTETSGSIAVIADAKDGAALRFYTKHGFLRLGSESNRVYLAMSSIRQLGTYPA
jgi:predicted GNAT family N-acyltransferase